MLEYGEWSPTIYAQMGQRDNYYKLLANQWSESEPQWIHELPNPDNHRPPDDIQASRSAFRALERVLEQNVLLHERLAKGMLDVNKQIKQTVQRRKFEQAYHPQPDLAGGFVTEQG
jgi:hypothetical protein